MSDNWPLDDPLAIGRRVLAEEADALQRTAAGLGADFLAAVQALLGCRGRVVVSGVGKSGHVGRRSPPPWPAPARRHSLCTPQRPATATSA